MTLDELVKALVYYQSVGHGARTVTQHEHPTKMDPTDTKAITGIFVADDGDEVVLETAEWRRSP